jgi:hypothetical protein
MGMGCAWCHVEAPIITGLAFGALGESCLLRAFSPWTWERLEGWLVRQRVAEARNIERARAYQAWRNGDPSLVEAYKEKYNVDLLR